MGVVTYEVNGYGNNPVPVIALGKCCDECNQNVVIPARYKAVKILEDFCNELD